MSPLHRPTLEQILSCELCSHASHQSAIRTLTEGKRVWTRRYLETQPSSLPSVSLMATTCPTSSPPIKKSFSMEITQSRLPNLLDRSQTLPHPPLFNQSNRRSETLNLLSSTCSTSDSILTNSSGTESEEQDELTETEMDVASPINSTAPSPLWDSLFQSPASRLITRWAEAQHSKCEQSLLILKNFHTAPPVRCLNPEPMAKASPMRAKVMSPMIIKKFPSLPPRFSSFSSKASSLQRKLSSVS
jgi:hypothetical protein